METVLSGKTYEISPFGRNEAAFMGIDIGGGCHPERNKVE